MLKERYNRIRIRRILVLPKQTFRRVIQDKSGAQNSYNEVRGGIGLLWTYCRQPSPAIFCNRANLSGLILEEPHTSMERVKWPIECLISIYCPVQHFTQRHIRSTFFQTSATKMLMGFVKYQILLLKVGFMGMIMVARSVTSQQEEIMGTPPSTDLLCISECQTCPVICSPPPSPSTPKSYPPPTQPVLPKSYPPPPPPLLLQYLSPPPPYISIHHSPPPVQSYYLSPPPHSESILSPPPPSQRPPPSAPSTSSSKGSPPPPPPPFKYFYNLPPGPAGQGPPTVVGPPHQYNYPYPYYYFYESKASTLSFQASLSLLMLLFLNAVLLH